MVYKCIIVDDSKIARDTLNMHLAKLDQLEIVARCPDALSAQKVLADNNIDIVFSDINMPDLSGIGLLKSLKTPPVFIFISSHAEHAAESFDLDVIDFIVKPISFERVVKSVNKAVEYLALKKAATKTPEAVPESKGDHFFIRESNSLVKLYYTDVAYIESMGHFSKINTIDGKKHITLVNLKNLEKQLPSDVFIRIHKQFIINYRNISSINSYDVTLSDKNNVLLSPLYRQELLNKIGNENIVTRSSTDE